MTPLSRSPRLTPTRLETMIIVSTSPTSHGASAGHPAAAQCIWRQFTEPGWRVEAGRARRPEKAPSWQFLQRGKPTYGLHPEGRIDYSQFGIDPNGKTITLLDTWRQEDLRCCDEGRIPVSGSRHAGEKILGWWHICAAEITGAHWL